MGESSACLMRSFSQPSPTSSEEKKVDPIQRALTSSISFGRFMSESLDWEKWSAFNHNRYLEEVERYSKPGSVAEKKAYFEAHYKRRRAAALLEQQNATESTASETNVTQKVDNDSSVHSELVKNCGMIVEVCENNSSDVKAGRTCEDIQFDRGGEEEITEPSVLVENSVELMNHLENDVCVGDTVSKEEEKIINNTAVSLRSPQSSGEEERPKISSSEILTNSNGVSSKNSPLTKPMVHVQLNKSDKKTPDSKNSRRDSGNKRRSDAASLHLSIGFASGFGGIQKAISPKIANLRISRPPAKKFVKSTSQTLTKASVNGAVKNHSVIPPENRRTKTLNTHSISGSRMFDGKLQSPSKNSHQSSNAFGSKARSSTVSAPFIFKSEERVAKRKEFFEKLEQKLKSKGSVKDKRHENSQGKAKGDLKGLHHSIALETTKNVEGPLTESSNILTKKIPRAKPHSPKIQERVVFKAQDNDPRPPWRFSLKTDSLKAGKKVSSTTSSKKCTRENNCPNIQA